MSTCPCGRDAAYPDCCGRYLDGGAPAPTAEALMRSRYSAYARGAVAYLWSTHHPDTRPDRASLAASVLGAALVHLRIHEATEDTVRFEAVSRDGHVLRETSRFVRSMGRWLYLNGELTTAQLARSAPCPCGSGAKFKRCCGG